MAHFKLSKCGSCCPFDIGSQHFSGGDYSKTKADDLGVVFPFNPEKETKNEFVVSSLIDHHTDDYHLLKHTEARDCNTIDNDLVYSEMLTASIVIHENELGHQSSARNSFFAVKDEFLETGYLEAKEPINTCSSEMLIMTEIYKNFKTLMDVDKDNIQEKRSTFTRYDYTNDGWRTPSLFGYNELGYIDDDYDPVIDEKIEKILDKWFKKTKLPIQLFEVDSYLFEYESLEDIIKGQFGGIMEFIILDNETVMKEPTDEQGLSELKKQLNFIRNKYKYTKQEIEKDSKRIMKVLEKQYESQ